MICRFMGRRALIAQQMRQFSLLVPVQPNSVVPADLLRFPATEAHLRQLEESYLAFNEQCKAELQMMNQNIIEDIMDRGGHDGWETEANLAYMQKQFEFKSFEEANSFVQHVSKFCNQKQHHPEWSVTNGGRTVNVKLTSHFAGNRVTRLDFELAEAMNNSYFLTAGKFSRSPLQDEKLWSTIRILVGSVVALSFFFKFVTGPSYSLKQQPRSGVPIKQEMDFSGPVALRSQQVADKFSRDHLIAWGSVQLHANQGRKESYEAKLF